MLTYDFRTTFRLLFDSILGAVFLVIIGLHQVALAKDDDGQDHTPPPHSTPSTTPAPTSSPTPITSPTPTPSPSPTPTLTPSPTPDPTPTTTITPSPSPPSPTPTPIAVVKTSPYPSPTPTPSPSPSPKVKTLGVVASKSPSPSPEQVVVTPAPTHILESISVPDILPVLGVPTSLTQAYANVVKADPVGAHRLDTISAALGIFGLISLGIHQLARRQQPQLKYRV